MTDQPGQWRLIRLTKVGGVLSFDKGRARSRVGAGGWSRRKRLWGKCRRRMGKGGVAGENDDANEEGKKMTEAA